LKYSQPYGLPDQPAIPSPNPPDGSAFQRYVNGNPVTGTAGSIPPASSIDEDQIEILNVIINAQQLTADPTLIPTHGDLTQLLRALNAMFAQRYITTHVEKVVHGSGADFSDMHAALSWLDQYIITQTGDVMFKIAPGAWTYTAPIEVRHPNSNRVTIIGQPLAGAAPTPNMFSYTGPHNASDGTYDYQQLSPLHNGCFATELIFSNGSQGFVNYGSGLTISQLLITGSQSNPPSLPAGQSDQTSATGIVAYADTYIEVTTCFGFGQYGLVALDCDVEIRGGPAFCCVFCLHTGIVLWGGFIGHVGDIISVSHAGAGISALGGTISNSPSGGNGRVYTNVNGGDGVYLNAANLQENGPAVCVFQGNQNNGLYMTGSSSAWVNGALFHYNGNNGANPQGAGLRNSAGYAACGGAANFTGNGTYDVVCMDGGNCDATGATLTLSRLTPPANTAGNGNAWISH